MADRSYADWLIDNQDRMGWGNEETAKRAGTSPTTISNIINGKIRRPHYRTLRKIAGAFGVEVPNEGPKAGAPQPETTSGFNISLGRYGEVRINDNALDTGMWIEALTTQAVLYEELLGHEEAMTLAATRKLMDALLEFVGAYTQTVRGQIRPLASGPQLHSLTEAEDRIRKARKQARAALARAFDKERDALDPSKVVELKKAMADTDRRMAQEERAAV